MPTFFFFFKCVCVYIHVCVGVSVSVYYISMYVCIYIFWRIMWLTLISTSCAALGLHCSLGARLFNQSPDLQKPSAGSGWLHGLEGVERKLTICLGLV